MFPFENNLKFSMCFIKGDSKRGPWRHKAYAEIFMNKALLMPSKQSGK